MGNLVGQPIFGLNNDRFKTLAPLQTINELDLFINELSIQFQLKQAIELLTFAGAMKNSIS